MGDRAQARRCVAQTGVCGVMCGEALLENPALFADGCDPATGEAIGVVVARGRSDA